MSKVININSPSNKTEIQKLNIGDIVYISGTIVTGRDALHKHLYDKYVIKKERDEMFEKLTKILDNSFIFHCGPIIRKNNEEYEFLAGGPTTSIREEPYEAEIIELFSLRGIIGKGGMGEKTLFALKANKAVYLHATGGCAVLLGECVKNVIDVFYLKEFGTPEAMWIVEVKNFPAIVTMDSMENSLHEKVLVESKENLSILS